MGDDVVDIDPRPSYATTLLNWPWVLIRFRCDHCPRRGDAKLAACAARYGEFITIGELLQIFRRSCPNSPEMRERRQQNTASNARDSLLISARRLRRICLRRWRLGQ